MTVICRLRELIDGNGLTQKGVAEATGLSPTIIGNLYRNNFRRIDNDTAETLCRHFKIRFGDLFEIDPDPTEEGAP